MPILIFSFISSPFGHLIISRQNFRLIIEFKERYTNLTTKGKWHKIDYEIGINSTSKNICIVTANQVGG